VFIIPNALTRHGGGYTLIELVVVTAIMALLIGGGIAALLQFQEKQALIGAAGEFKVYLRSAQDRARAGDRPEDCDHLLSYAIRTVDNTNQVQMVAVCDNAEVIRKITTLQATGVTFGGTYNIRFATLQGGVSGATTVVLSSTAGREYSFAVTQGGEITEGVMGDAQ
jgi:prepilin-type N-terminal cleavage/methylation domain-containing protein